MTVLVYLWWRTFNTSFLNTHKHYFQSHSLQRGAITCCDCRNQSSCPSPCNITCGWTEPSEFTRKWFSQLLSTMSPLSAFQTTQSHLNPWFKEPSLDGQPVSRSIGNSSEETRASPVMASCQPDPTHAALRPQGTGGDTAGSRGKQ